MRLPHWLRRRVRRYDRRWLSEQAEREHHDAVVAARLAHGEAKPHAPLDEAAHAQPQTTALVVRKERP